MGEGKEQLLREFPPVSAADWRSLVEEGLKGGSFDKQLVTQTHEGFPLQPLYTREDQLSEGSGFPGFAPFTRGIEAVGSDGAGWEIRQEHADPDWKVTRCAIAKEVERGGDSLWLRFDEATRRGLDSDVPDAPAGVGGLLGCSADQVAQLFHCSPIDAVPVLLDAGASGLGVGALWIAASRAKGVGTDALEGNLGSDPLGVLAMTGALPASLGECLTEMADAAAWAAEAAPRLRAVLVSTAPYHDAGATAAHELAYALATGVAYLRRLEAAGLSVDRAAAQMEFSFSVGRDFFMEIAKLRAARLVWAKVVGACGGDPAVLSMKIHARTSARTKTARDPWVNMLRGTIESFAAGVGGADSLATSAFDEALGLPDEFSRRVATNTQVLLKEESHLKRVIDPAGGSWYVEWLTDRLAREAWELFQGIEAEGGMAEALGSGSVAAQVREAAERKRKAIAKRKDAITGVSEFANLGEASIEKEAPDLEALRAAAADGLEQLRAERDASAVGEALAALATSCEDGQSGARMAAAVEAACAGATLGELSQQLRREAPRTAEALRAERAAAGFEALRDASDAAFAETGKRPPIFLANLGPIPKHKARSSFAQNFFEAAGMEALSNDGFETAEAAASAFAASGAELAVLCSADGIYAEMAEETAKRLKQAGASQVLLAGRPGDKEEAYRAAGIDRFIFVGADVLETLRTLLAAVGVLK